MRYSLNQETEKWSDRLCSNDFESIHISEFQTYFLRMNNQYILKVPKYLRSFIIFRWYFICCFQWFKKMYKNCSLILILKILIICYFVLSLINVKNNVINLKDKNLLIFM
jgi:hypothetical protein